ncbi:putative bifunctional diguanylate cyclase/phosphodiesterase [Paracraurococcus ruber]|uniref:Diguanylate cyclase (GGDEF) domain-containing protein n=1 Tax=Paracraurococcus ruber TaxID=77675 RepID=A0ABS1CVV6_9PROT|nr:EAL domain-containing protein [Paracraurococcus ruber]MBK1658441.1 hypothetical protein [Paracraurococcus ruber]TDG32112.1 EAL domain-containing protein [Paracraurococcus ruber]
MGPGARRLRRRFDDLPLAWKLLFLPALTAVLSAVMLAVAVHWARSGTGALQALDRDVFEPVLEAHRLEDGISLTHAGLSALILKRVIEAESRGWEGQAARIRPELEAHASSLDRLRAGLGELGAGGALRRVERAFAAYRDDVEATVAMAATDAAFATILMLQADLHFAEWRTAMEDLVGQLADRRRTLAEAAASAGSTALQAVAGLALLSTLVTLAGGVLIPARTIGRPLLRLADAVRRPAAAEDAVPGTARRDEIGTLARAVAAARQDAATLLRREAELTEINHRFDLALANMAHGLCMLDAEARLVVANARFAAMLGLPAGLVRPGLGLDRILGPWAARGALQGRPAEAAGAEFRARLAAAATGSFVERLADGATIAITHQAMPAGGWVLVFEDISARREAEARIAHLALHDALTDLPNRVLFRQRLEEALQRARRGHAAALLCLDLDRFKEVNDTLGHSVGDALLQAVTARVGAALRGTDMLARLGGDEFAIIQTDAPGPEAATALAQRLVDQLGQPFDLHGHQVIIGASIGIAFAPDDGDDPETLMKAGDLALYRAKADGRGCWRFFEAAMDARLRQRRTAELDLRRALAAGEFELFYQPVIALPDRRVGGMEALLRWRHPEKGIVPPDGFVPLAEEIGLLIPLGEWVLRRACADAMTWPAPLKVAVNLSPAQFASRGLVQAVAGALEASGLEAGRLELEITETVMLQDNQATLATLERLRALGVRIAMDDFGTGYSSLSYLQKFRFDKVKIDRSFTSGLGASRESQVIIDAVTSLCEGLAMVTTAEGVETEAQMEALCRSGCREAQGFLFSRPRPAAEVPAMLASLRDQASIAIAAQ